MNKIVLDERIRHLWLWEQPEKLRCWIDLMLMADDEGRVEVSIRKLAKRWEMPMKTIHRMLNDFQATKLLTIVSTKNGTILSLGCDTLFDTLKYDNYQRVTKMCDTPNDTPLQNNTSDTPNDTQSDTLKYDNYQRVTKMCDTPNDTQNDSQKEEKPPHTPLKEKNTTTADNNNARTCVREGSRPAETQKSHEQDCKMIASLLNSKSWTERTCMNNRITVAEFTRRINDFKNWLFNTQHPGHGNVKDLLVHFWSWLRTEKQREQDAEDRRNNKQKQFLTADDKLRMQYEQAEAEWRRDVLDFAARSSQGHYAASGGSDADDYVEPEYIE